VAVRSILLFWRADWSFSSTVGIVDGDDPALLLQAGASRAFSSTHRSAHLQLLSVSAESGGHHTRAALTAASSMEHTFMMVLDHVGDQEAIMYAQLGQQPLVRTTETSP
jgi:hypothetical protein